MLGQIVIGLMMMAGGVALMYYSGPLSQVFGRSARAEQYLGGTKNAVVLFGFLIIVLGVLFAFGVFNGMTPGGNISTTEF